MRFSVLEGACNQVKQVDRSLPAYLCKLMLPALRPRGNARHQVPSYAVSTDSCLRYDARMPCAAVQRVAWNVTNLSAPILLVYLRRDSAGMPSTRLGLCWDRAR
jgi:hypothetical protein